MKNTIIALFILINISSAQNRWEFVNPLPTGFDLHDVEIDGSGSIWVFGESGTIINSSNKFKDWENIETNIWDDFYDAEFVNNNIWVVGENGVILHSENAGINWSTQISNTNLSLLKVNFVDEFTGWIMTKYNLLLKTSDGGENWEHVTIKNNLPLNDLLFVNENHGFLLSGIYYDPNFYPSPSTSGALFITGDGGNTWTILDSGETKYSSIDFLNDSIGFMSIHNYTIGRKFLKTLDSGKSWDTLYSWSWEQMEFVNEQKGFAVGEEYFGSTEDGGLTWKISPIISTPSPSSKLTSFKIYNDIVFAVGTEGNIIESKNYGSDWNSLKSEIDFYYANLYGITFTNNNDGYIYGEQYLSYPKTKPIFKITNDSGITWNDLISPDSVGISKLVENDESIWVTCGSKLYHREKDESDWELFHDVGNERIRDVHVFNNLHIILISGRSIHRTTTGGKYWTKNSEFGVSHLRYFIPISLRNWILLGSNAVTHPCYKTNDAGRSWHVMKQRFTSMQFFSEKVGFAIDSSLFKTIDGGISWTLVNESLKGKIAWTAKLNFYNGKVGWIQNFDHLLYTNDSGYTWIRELGIKDYWSWSGSTFSIVNEENAWAVSSNGHIYKLSENGITYTSESEKNNRTNYFLHQNYPNPFNPKTKIQYSIPEKGNVKIYLFDILGNEIEKLVDEEKEFGTYLVEFDAKDLASGIYFYRIHCNTFSETKKMVLLK